MKYKENEKVVRTKTGQVFTIAGKKESRHEAGHCIKREPIYQLKGPHRSLDLLVSQSELDTYFEKSDYKQLKTPHRKHHLPTGQTTAGAATKHDYIVAHFPTERKEKK